MRRFLIPLLTALLLAVAAAGQEPATKAKAQRLPLYWSKLSLSADQKQKAVTIQNEYAGKIQLLKDQIKNLEADEAKALNALLTENQRGELQKLLAKKAGIETPQPTKPNEKP